MTAIELLMAAGGDVVLAEVTRRAVRRADGSVRATPSGEPVRLAHLQPVNGAALLSSDDCRRLARRLVDLARSLDEEDL